MEDQNYFTMSSDNGINTGTKRLLKVRIVHTYNPPMLQSWRQKEDHELYINSLGYRLRETLSHKVNFNFPHIYQAKTTRNSIRKCCTSHKQHDAIVQSLKIQYVCMYTCHLIDTS